MDNQVLENTKERHSQFLEVKNSKLLKETHKRAQTTRIQSVQVFYSVKCNTLLTGAIVGNNYK